jgi:hypothetical protein
LNIIRAIEELSFNKLPTLQTIHIDGWVLRSAKSYTKRANSNNSPYASPSNTHEEIYRRKQLPAVFKMTGAV